jgi:hypothetical protein
MKLRVTSQMAKHATMPLSRLDARLFRRMDAANAARDTLAGLEPTLSTKMRRDDAWPTYQRRWQGVKEAVALGNVQPVDSTIHLPGVDFAALKTGRLSQAEFDLGVKLGLLYGGVVIHGLIEPTQLEELYKDLESAFQSANQQQLYHRHGRDSGYPWWMQLLTELEKCEFSNNRRTTSLDSLPSFPHEFSRVTSTIQSLTQAIYDLASVLYGSVSRAIGISPEIFKALDKEAKDKVYSQLIRHDRLPSDWPADRPMLRLHDHNDTFALLPFASEPGLRSLINGRLVAPNYANAVLLIPGNYLSLLSGGAIKGVDHLVQASPATLRGIPRWSMSYSFHNMPSKRVQEILKDYLP